MHIKFRFGTPQRWKIMDHEEIGWGPMEGFCEYGDEISDSIGKGKLLTR